MRTRRFSATPGARQAYLDCELCGGDPDGINTFSMIQLASDAGNATGLVFLCSIFSISPARISAHGRSLNARPVSPPRWRM
jgi:alkaline phosphatase